MEKKSFTSSHGFVDIDPSITFYAPSISWLLMFPRTASLAYISLCDTNLRISVFDFLKWKLTGDRWHTKRFTLYGNTKETRTRCHDISKKTTPVALRAMWLWFERKRGREWGRVCEPKKKKKITVRKEERKRVNETNSQKSVDR